MVSVQEAPRLYHGTKHYNVGSAFEHGRLPDRATDSGRSALFFSAAVTPLPIRGNWAQGDFHDFRGDIGPGGSHNDNPTTLESYKFDSWDAVVVDAQKATCRGCQFYISDTHANLCREKVPNAAMISFVGRRRTQPYAQRRNRGAEGLGGQRCAEGESERATRRSLAVIDEPPETCPKIRR